MEETIWKARVQSTRTIERMKFLRAYWGRSTLTAKLWAPDREYPITQVILRCVERVYDEVIKDLEARAKRPAEPFMLHEGAKAAWWLKMARDGRNGDPFPGAVTCMCHVTRGPCIGNGPKCAKPAEKETGT